MADITMQFALSVANGNLKEQFDLGQFTDEQTTARMLKFVADIGTADEAVGTGDLTTPRWCIVRNLDDANYVSLGPDSGGAIVALARIEPGDWGCLPLAPGVTLRAQANTAACDVLFIILDA